MAPSDKGFDYFYGIPASMNYGILTYIENRRILDPPTLWTAKKSNEIAIADYRITPPYSQDRGELDLEVAPSFDDQQVLTKFTDKAVEWIDSFADRRGRRRSILPLPCLHVAAQAGDPDQRVPRQIAGRGVTATS